ncbi:MAG: Tex family protein [Bacteroidota bacterium]
MASLLPPLISKTLSIPLKQVSATVELLAGGATIPFISRYRKEVTGSLDETQVAAIQAELKKLEELVKRKETIIKSIEDQDKMTPELLQKIKDCWDSATLEDIYLPFKPKRKTRATMAREKGLEPLAKILMAQRENNIEQRARQFLSSEVDDTDVALSGARDIIAEWINEHAYARNSIRTQFEKFAVITSKVIAKKKDEATKYKDYFDFSESLKRIPSHRLLAIRRGEDEGFLRVSINVEKEHALNRLDRIFLKNDTEAADQVQLAIDDAFQRLLSPSIETEFRNRSKEKADEEAIAVFSENLKQLLLAAPLGEKAILAIDPGFRTGCKVACIDDTGTFNYHTTIFPHPPQQQTLKAAETIRRLVSEFEIDAVAVGNGTAGRETERFVKSALDKSRKVEVFVVNEAGASIYSASETAREEFPDLDLTVRGAISIGRRLMDPLAELVKIDPKSIGVGQYQHDVNQKKLKESLDLVVSSAVNQVGVNLNTASQHLLQYVSGIGPKLANSIIAYRNVNGAFESRSSLKHVSGLGAKAFEQSAGFLRIPEGKNPLDNSAVHPERYKLVTKMAKEAGATVETLMDSKASRKAIDLKRYISNDVGLPTLNDIMKELEKPGLDPRGEAEVFSFSDALKDINDLKAGMVVPGVVTNLVKFGAFIDIGIKENGLVHISQIADKFIKDPSEVLRLDQKVKVQIESVDHERGRIQLSMKNIPQ